MQAFRIKGFAPVVALGLMSVSLGCDNGDGGILGDLAEECGLSCPAEGIAQGNAQISGVASLDAFFGAVIDVQSAAANVRASMRAELDAIALSVGLQRGAAPSDVAVAVRGYIDAHVDGGLKVEYKPATCSASVEVAAKAAAECDVDVDPGTVEVRCEGACEVDASAMASCEADATLVCEYTPPDLNCQGTCTGTCELEVAAMCEGTCRGTCNGTCSVTNANGECAGECMGTCEGSCELSAGGSCSGSCEGTCEYTPPSGMCDASAKAKCEANAEASVACEGKCEGTAEPPQVDAECEATVEAKANASVECTPPELQIGFQWAAGVDAQAQGEFKAWLQRFRTSFSAMLAAGKKGQLVLEAGQGMITAAGGVVSNAAGEIQASGDLKAQIGAGCALTQLGNVQTALSGAVSDLQFSVDALLEMQGTVSTGE